MPKITFRDVSKKYKVGKTEVVALEKVNFEIMSGEIVMLSGTSGSGKSTILKIMSGIDFPSSGKVIVDDLDLGSLRKNELSEFRRRNVGIIFQQFYLDENLSLKHNVEISAFFSGMNSDKRKARTDEILRMLGLADRAKHLSKELSGGQIQRVAIGRAIYNLPKILIADEPTSNLDESNVEIFFDIVKWLNQKYNSTVIIASHDDRFYGLANRIIRIKEGRVYEN